MISPPPPPSVTTAWGPRGGVVAALLSILTAAHPRTPCGRGGLTGCPLIPDPKRSRRGGCHDSRCVTTGRAAIFTGGRPVRLPDHRDGWSSRRLMRDAEADIARGG